MPYRRRVGGPAPGPSALKTSAVVGMAALLCLALFVRPSAGNPVVAICFAHQAVTLHAGAEFELAVLASLGDGSTQDISAAAATFRSANPLVAAVDAGGVVSAADGAVTGEVTTVTASYGNFEAAVEVRIVNSLSLTVEPDDRGLPVVTNHAALDAVICKQRNLPADYVPADLVVPDVRFAFSEQAEKRYLRECAARAIEELFAAARTEGMELVAVSGYRSYETQDLIFRRNVALHGREQASRFSAEPGQSEHQTGLAMDVSCARVGFRLVEEFADTPEGRWLADNAPGFGFIIRYPAGSESITGYMYEPWHLRYVGPELAGEISGRKLTMEEYFAG